jgi:hypothetical protein
MVSRPLRRVTDARARDRLLSALACLLVVALAHFLFDAAVHSVHHLDSEDEATQCWVAVAAGCLSLVSHTPIAVGGTAAVVIGVVAIAVSRPPAPRVRGAARDRAPPAPLFA